MTTEAKQIGQIIPATLASVKTTQSTTTGNLPSEDWNAKWLRLKTKTHPKLKVMERDVGRFCFDLYRTPDSGRLLLLFGENGTGKTHCAQAVHRWLMSVGHSKQFIKRANHVSSIDCIYWHYPAFLDALKSGAWDVVDDMLECTVLIIDEVGGGHDPSRVGVDKLCQVLSRRERMWTLLTTNVLPADWETVLDRKIASRFFRNCQQIDLADVPDFMATQ